MPQCFAPAAQYLRMSTDHQQYSLDNQADAISRYAVDHGFVIVKTYSDAARSGLRLKNRSGLKQLLKDVVDGRLEFRAVLVYDVSRWGRFQDVDEAAHYEYLCKSSGVPVHYCAEMFSNDNSMSGLIMKAVKRTMAGEYSRELSVKVRAGLFRLATLGYKLGGSVVYGLRRQLLDAKGTPKHLLADGEQKSIANEHVIIVPGPPNEIAVVRRIFHEFANERRSPDSIAVRLNKDQIPFLRGTTWKGHTIRNMLQDPHYVGSQVWGRTTALLSSPVKRLPSEQWAICPTAFEPIISQELYDGAQRAFANLTCRLTDEQMLDRLRQVLKIHGRLNTDIIEKAQLCPRSGSYHNRFGGLLNVYALLGYRAPDVLCTQISTRQKVLLVRSSLIQRFLKAFPDQIQEVRVNRHFRSLLRYRKTGQLISVVLARCCPTKSGSSWLVEAPMRERKRLIVLALLDEANTSVKTLMAFPRVAVKELHFRVRADSEWLRSGAPLESASQLLDVMRRIRAQ